MNDDILTEIRDYLKIIAGSLQGQPVLPAGLFGQSEPEPPAMSDSTLNQWLDEWLNLYKVDKVKPATLYRQKTLIRHYISNSPLGHTKLSKINGMLIQKFLMEISASRQREKVCGILKDCIKRARALGYVTEDPFLAVEIPKHINKKSKALNAEEESAFVKACLEEKHCNAFLIMLFAGLRRGEAFALTEKDIDIQKRLIRVTKSVDEFENIGTPKTKNSVRDVPMLNPLPDHLKKYSGNGDNFLFKICDSTSHKVFTRILEKAGLDGRGFTIHSLRHTFATRCAERGVPPKVVQRWLGHSTVDMTMNIYTHVNKDYENSVVQNLNKTIKLPVKEKEYGQITDEAANS